jgi:RHS repeat-associated protein
MNLTLDVDCDRRSLNMTRQYHWWRPIFRTSFLMQCLMAMSLSSALADYPTNSIKDMEDELYSVVGTASATGVPKWYVSEPYINLWIYDQPLTYTTSYGAPVGFGIAHKQRNSRSNNKIFNLGPNWESSWLSYAEYSTSGTNVTIGTTYMKLGGGRLYVADGVTPHFKSASTISKLYSGTNFTGFQISYASGAKETYGYLFNVAANENYALLSEQIDAVGHTNLLKYDTISAVVRLRQLIDPDNRTNTIRYDTTLTNQISEVEDPYGRKATFSYGTNGLLASLVNVGSLTNFFNYDGQQSNAVTNFVTIYGTNYFYYAGTAGTSESLGGYNQVNRLVDLAATDGTRELFIYRDRSTEENPNSAVAFLPYSFSTNDVPNTGSLSNTFDNSLQSARNSFHWSSLQYDGLIDSDYVVSGDPDDLVLADYKLARRRQWLRRYNNEEVVTDTLSLEQAGSPDGSAWGQVTWFDYAGKASGYNGTRGTNALPRFAALVLSDGATRYTYVEANQRNNPTRTISTYNNGSSVSTRTNTFSYSSDGFDLIETRGPGNEFISSNIYNSFHQVVTNYNAVNDQTVFTYDSGHRLTSVVLPTGLLTTNYYLTSGTNTGWLDKTIDLDNGTAIRTNSFTYEMGLIKTATDPRGLNITNAWDNLQRLTSKSLPSGIYSYAYTNLDLLSVTDPVGSTNRFTYDLRRRISTASDPKGTNIFGYDCGMLCTITNAVQQVLRQHYDYNGNRTNVTYPDGSVILHKFNLSGQLTNQVDAAGTSLRYFYNNQGLLMLSSNAVGQVFAHQYDNRDRLTNAVDANGVSIALTYDALNRVLTKTYPDGGVEKFGYSARGMTRYTNQLGQVTGYGYDVLGRQTSVTNANNEVVRYTYGPAGDMLTLTDGKSQVTQFAYDQYGQLTNKVDALGTNILRFQYDADGRMTNRWTVAKGGTTYRYDLAHNLTNIVYPVSSNIVFSYDAENRLTNLVDGVGTTVFAYNSFGALASEDGPWANDSVSYTYKTNHLRASMTVLQQDGSSVEATSAYDSVNRLQTIASPAGTFTYSYQGAGGLIQKLALPNSAYITNSYDSMAHRLFTNLRNSSHTDLNVHSYGYNVGNQRTNQTRTDGSYINYTYDNIGQLRTAIGKESSGVTNRLNEQLSYSYDAAWNISYRTNNALVQTFTSESRNRLTALDRSGTLTVSGNTTVAATNVTVNSSAATRYGDYTFAKDGLTVTNGNNSFTVVAQDSAGRADTNVITANLPTTANFSYDANGNLTSDGLRAFEYDDENQLTRITVTNSWKSEFSYDGLGRRRVRAEYVWFGSTWTLQSRVRYLYDGNLVVHERSDREEPPVNYTRGLDLSGGLQGAGGIGGLLARSQNVDGTAQHHYYHAEANGNVTAMVNSSQVVVARYLYDPFGNLLASSGGMADINLYRFSSKEAHENSGLYYYGRRFYEPRLQRWLNGDPIGENGGINLFQFCGGDPINGVDAWGEYLMTVTMDASLADRYGYSLVSNRSFQQLAGENISRVKAEGGNLTIWDVDSEVLANYGSLKLSPGSFKTEDFDYGGAVSASIHDALGVAGIFDPTGVLDAADGLLHLAEGNSGAALLSAAAILPGGDFTKLKNLNKLRKADDVVDAVKEIRLIPNGPPCFIAGTLIATENGFKPIEEIQSGDKVWAFNELTGEKALREVVRAFEKSTDILVELEVGSTLITTTPEHPFWVDNQGWVTAGELAIGDLIGTLSGELEGVKRVERQAEQATVYNFEVDEFHTYFVTATGLLVHNSCKVNSPEKQALIDMAKADKRTGMTRADMQAYKDLNKQLPDPFPANQVRGPEVHPNRGPHAQQPHGHVGPVDYIPIK